MQKEDKKKPDFEVRLNGIRLAIWENETDGREWFSAAASRRVVDPNSKEAKYYNTYNGVADLVLLRAAIDQGIDWMNRRRDEQAIDDE